MGEGGISDGDAGWLHYCFYNNQLKLLSLLSSLFLCECVWVCFSGQQRREWWYSAISISSCSWILRVKPYGVSVFLICFLCWRFLLLCWPISSMRDLIAHVHLSLAFFLLCHGNLRPLSFIFSSFSSLCQLPPCLAPCLLWQLPSAPYPLHVIHFCAHFNSFFLFWTSKFDIVWICFIDHVSWKF